MIVESDPQVARLTALVLQRLGYRSEIVIGAIEAMMRIDRQPDAYACVLTDYEMEPIHGDALAAHVKANTASAHIKCVLVSGHRDIDRIAAASKVFDDYLGKPFEFDDIVGLIRRYVADPQPDAPIYCPRCGTIVGTAADRRDLRPVLANHSCVQTDTA